MRLLPATIVLAAMLSGCGTQHSQAVQACEIFIKERLRSPSTYKRISENFSGVAFESGGRSVKLVSIAYDAANAYGTPIRSSQQCTFAVDDAGRFIESDLTHAARMSAIGSGEYASCCSSKAEDVGGVADNIDAIADAAIANADAALANIDADDLSANQVKE